MPRRPEYRAAHPEHEWSLSVRRSNSLPSLDPDMMVIDGAAVHEGPRVGWVDCFRLAVGYANVGIRLRLDLRTAEELGPVAIGIWGQPITRIWGYVHAP